MHAAAMSLEQLGITQLPEDTYLSFKLLNSQLNPPGRAGLFALRTTQLSIEEMIAGEGGIFGAVAYHADAEDIRGVDSRFVRDAYIRSGLETIKHFTMFNIDTNVVVTYPEVCYPASSSTGLAVGG